MQIKDYIDSNKERFLDELYDLLRIESVSADPKYKDSVDRAADYLVDQFNKLNLDAVEKIKTAGHPIVMPKKLSINLFLLFLFMVIMTFSLLIHMNCGILHPLSQLLKMKKFMLEGHVMIRDKCLCT